MDYQTTILEIKRGPASASGEVEGYASTFGNIDEVADKIERGAFKNVTPDNMPKMLFNHDMQSAQAIPIGIWTHAEEDNKGLYVKGRLFIDGDNAVPAAKAVYRGLQEGVINRMSIGYIANDYHYEGDIRVIKDVELVEVSFVNRPANTQAVVTSVKSQDVRGIERGLRDEGFSANAAATAVSVFKKSKHWACDATQETPVETQGDLGAFTELIKQHLKD